MSSSNGVFASDTKSISGNGHIFHFFGAAIQPSWASIAALVFGGTAITSIVALAIGIPGAAGGFIIGEATHYALCRLGIGETKATVIAGIVQTVAFVVITGLISAPILGGFGAGMLFGVQCLAGGACFVGGLALLWLVAIIGIYIGRKIKSCYANR